MLPVVIPVGIIGLLAGAGLATSRRGLSMLPKSPLPGVLIVRWVRFTTIMARHPRSFDSPRGRMGSFGMDARRLTDVGLASAPHKATIGNETGVWIADWKKPFTKKGFLSSTPVQYEAFKRSMVSMVPTVKGFVGTKIGNVSCSLSGLLGVGHLAGAAGVASWVKDPAVRKKFQKTTDTFNLTNGIF